jgi:hypothetical protein
MRWLGLVALLAMACGGSSGGDGDGGNGGGPDADTTPGEYADPLVLLSSITAQGSHILETRVHPDGRVLYCSARRGVTIVNASNPNVLVETNTLMSRASGQMSRRCQHLSWSGDLLTFTQRGDEVVPTPFVSVFDMSGTPTEIASYTSNQGWSFEGIAMVGTMIYVAIHGDGLAVLEHTGAMQLSLRGVATGMDNAWGVAADGTTIYVADAGGEVVVVDASTPGDPEVIGRVEVGGAAQSIELDTDADMAYVAAGSAGLYAVDISDPANPVVVDNYDTPGSALQVYLDGNGRAHVADWNDLRIFDIADPPNLTLIATESPPVMGAYSRVLGAAAMGDTSYIGEWGTLFTYDLDTSRSAPDVWVDDPEIDFGTVSSNTSDAVAVIVRNEGTEPLAIYEITTTAGQFTIDPPELWLAPGDADVLELVFSPDSDSAIEAELHLKSDDPDQPTHIVTLAGNQPGIGVGDPAPEVAVQLHGGGNWTLSDQLGSPVLLAYFATF